MGHGGGHGGGGGGHGGGGMPRGGPRGPFIGGRGGSGYGPSYYDDAPLYVVSGTCQSAVAAECAASYPTDPASRAGCLAAGNDACSPVAGLGFTWPVITPTEKVAAVIAGVALAGLVWWGYKS